MNGREGARLGALPVFWVTDDSGLNQDGEAGVDRKAGAREAFGKRKGQDLVTGVRSDQGDQGLHPR